MSRPVIGISTSTTLTAAHSGCDILATGGQITLTLPAPISSCDIRIINGDSSAGKILAGFPTDVNPKLYPNQSISVNSDGTVWFAEEKPGRWKIPAGTIIYVGTLAGCNDANDGLSPATALLTNSMASQVYQKDFDCSYSTPIVAWMAGSVFTNDPFNASGQPLASNLVQLSLYGTGHVSSTCTGPCIVIGDNGELNMAWKALTSTCTATLMGNSVNAPSNATIYQHNNGLFDMSGGDVITIIGAGTNCSAVFFDGPTPGASISDGFNVSNTFGYLWHMDEGGGRYTFSGTIRQVGATIIKGLFAVLGGNELLLGGMSFVPDGSYLSLGASLVDDSLLVSNGIPITGGVTTVGSGRMATSKTT